MPSARQQLVAALSAQFPQMRVVGFADLPDAIAKPMICCWADFIERRADVSSQSVQVRFEVWLLVGTERIAAAEDALDEHVEAVYRALQEIPWIEFTSGERATLDDRWHGWRFSVTAPFVTL